MRKRPLERNGRTHGGRLAIWLLASLATMCWTLSATAGTRLRVTERDATRHMGAFGGLREDTLLLTRPGGPETEIALRAIATVEESRGLHGHSLLGAGIGLCAGAIVGGELGSRLQPLEGTGANSSFAAGGAILLGAAGALVGALAGMAWQSEKWAPIPMKELHVLTGFSESGAPRVALVRRF